MWYVYRLLCLLMVLGSAPAEAAPGRRGPIRRPPRPQLLLTVDKVTTAQGVLPSLAPRVTQAMRRAIQAEPLTVDTLGLKRPSPAQIRRALWQRRLRWYSLTLSVDQVTHRVTSGSPRTIEASARVTLTLTRQAFYRKTTITLKGEGRQSVPFSVLLHGEVLATRLSAVEAALNQALQRALGKLIPGRRPRP